MKTTIVIVLALVACVSSAALQAPRADAVNLGTALKQYYAAIQKMLHCGYAPWHVPSFSPYKLDKLPIDVESEDFKFKGSISNLVVSGLDRFEFLNLAYDEKTGSLSMDYIFPEIHLLGEYDIESMVKMAGFPIDTSGKGVMNMKWEDLRAVGGFTIAPSSSAPNGLEISNFKLDAYMANVVVNNWNNLWNIAANNYANKVAREHLIMISQQTQQLGGQLYEKYVVPHINELLSNVTMEQLVDFIEDATVQLNLVDCSDKH